MLSVIVDVLLGMSKGRDVKLVFEDFIKYIAYAMRFNAVVYCDENYGYLDEKVYDRCLIEMNNLNYKYGELSEMHNQFNYLLNLLLGAAKMTSPHNIIFEIAKELGLSTTSYKAKFNYLDIIRQGDSWRCHKDSGSVEEICEYVSEKAELGYDYKVDFYVEDSCYYSRLYIAYIVFNLFDIPATLVSHIKTDSGNMQEDIWDTKQERINWFSPIEPEEIAI